MKWNGVKVTAAVRRAVMRGVAGVANDVRNDAINSITSGQKSGRIYQRRGIVHQASAPGEPPAADTGILHGSITVQLFPATLSARVNASAKYSAALEFGTTRIQPRPYLRHALSKHNVHLTARVAAEVKLVMK